MFATVKHRRGLYFKSMLCTSWGLSVRAAAYNIQYFSPRTPWYVGVTLSQLGWVCMVSGFALVLWSRLGLILQSGRTKRYLLGMIVFNGVVFHTAMTVLTYAVWGFKQHPTRHVAARLEWIKVQAVFEKIQIMCFCGQEILISSLYIRAAYKYLRNWGNLAPQSSRIKIREAMILLLAVQAVVVLIDIALITIDFLGLIKLKGFIHSFIYCAKLELEFVVLNQLVEISRLGVPGLPSTSTRSSSAGETNFQSSPPPRLERWSDATLQLPRNVTLELGPEKVICVQCSTVIPLALQTKQPRLRSAFEGLPDFANVDRIEEREAG
jgi:hypothetical protein